MVMNFGCSWHALPGGDPEGDPGHSGVTMSLGWPWNAGEREVWVSLLRQLPPQPGPKKAEDERWMDGHPGQSEGHFLSKLPTTFKAG